MFDAIEKIKELECENIWHSPWLAMTWYRRCRPWPSNAITGLRPGCHNSLCRWLRRLSHCSWLGFVSGLKSCTKSIVSSVILSPPTFTPFYILVYLFTRLRGAKGKVSMLFRFGIIDYFINTVGVNRFLSAGQRRFYNLTNTAEVNGYYLRQCKQ